MKKNVLHPGIIAGLILLLVLFSSLKSQPGKDVIRSFNHEGVELLDGRLKAQFEQVKEFYLSIRNNDILKGFRERSGNNVPGKHLGGFHSQSGHSLGQWLSGFARMYKSTGDQRVRDKAVYLMEEWAKTIAEDGSFHNWGKSSHYVYHWYVGGLVDMYEYIGSENALKYLNTITDWAEKNLDRTNPYAEPGLPYHEWYIVSENLFRAYEQTGNKRFYDFAKVWEYNDYWGIFARGESVFQDILKSNPEHQSYHSYSHVNTFGGAAMAYKVTGEDHYLQTIKNAYQFMQNTQCYATGGYGPEENFVVPDGMPETLVGVRRGESNVNVRFHFETSCGSWAGFKMSRYLMNFTGDAFYGDWIERLIYNGVGAMIPMNDDGMIMYGSKYHLYGAQKSLFTTWFCCQGSLPLTISDYYNLIYFHDKKSLYVNLYVPSKVDWQGPDGLVTVTQETRFPETESVTLHVQTNNASRFGIKFRVPEWAHDGVSVKINNKNHKITSKPGSWAEIDRKWNNNDKVTLLFDLAPRIEPLPGYVSPVAVMRGPVVMVASTARENEQWVPTEADLRFPADWIMGEDPLIAYSESPSMKAPVNPKRNLHTNQVMRPYYDLNSGEYYRMYFERAGAGSVLPSELVFNGDWVTEGDIYFAEKPQSSFDTKFSGNVLVWEGLRTNDAGIAKVIIDGKEVADVDQYGYTDVYVGRLDQREVPFRWSVSGLGSGEHSLKVILSSDKNQSSAGTKLNIKRLVTYP